MAKIKSLGGVGMAKIKSLGGVENQNVLNFRGKKLNRLGGVFFNFSRRIFSILVFNFHIGTTLNNFFSFLNLKHDILRREVASAINRNPSKPLNIELQTARSRLYENGT